MNCKIKEIDGELYMIFRNGESGGSCAVRIEGKEDVVSVMNECQSYLADQGDVVPTNVRFIHQYVGEKEIGLGFAFTHKGEHCRTAVKISKEVVTAPKIVDVFNKLQKVMENPLNPEYRVLNEKELLIGNEMEL